MWTFFVDLFQSVGELLIGSISLLGALLHFLFSATI